MPDVPPPAAAHSIHGPFLEQAIPTWLVDAPSQRRQALKDTDTPLPAWYRHASHTQRHALSAATAAGVIAQTRLDKALAPLQDIDSFAEPLLVKALHEQFNVQLDVRKTWLRLKKPVEVGVFAIDIASFEVLRLPLLQAALHNFEAWECEPGAFHESSGFLAQTSTEQTFEPVASALTVVQFTGLCRSLDIGAQYQAYLKAWLHPADAVSEQVLRDKFIGAQKSAMGAAAELALLKKDIEPADYAMLLSVIDGQDNPTLGGKPVWFRDLSLMKHRMTGCVVFVISEKYRYADELILYIPNDPEHPLKRYTVAQLRARFKRQFTTRGATDPSDGGPSAYARFFSRFVAYADRPDYFNQLTEDAPDISVVQKLLPYAALFNELINGSSPFSGLIGINELPPAPPLPKIPNPDPYLAPVDMPRKGRGIWADNGDLWHYLFERHRDQVIADARSHAVPTADVDARVRSEKFARLLNIGMLVLTAVSMFVPVLGELMMTVMAGQLLEETFAGTLEWSEGDRKAAKAHLLDVAENLAVLALTAGAGKALGKLLVLKPEPLIENLEPVTLPNGQVRLCKPQLQGYASSVSLEPSAGPDAQGLHRLDGKTYIRQDGHVYETTFDESLERWRIKHPSDPQAYQPLLNHNGAGAWRHTLERPQAWDRLTLLRRMGPVTDAFDDEQLLQLADISGVSDNALRKMHLDNATPPPELADALRLFKADQDVAQVIEQVGSGQAIDGRYLFILPLITELPRWPVGRMLEVFEGSQLSGPSLRYGAERLFAGAKAKPVIRITRADVLSSKLPERVLAALEEDEISTLLGGEAARVADARPQEFRKQIADYARTRQPALFDSLYQGADPKAPDVAKLQRLCPGLSADAAQAVLARADAEQLSRLRGNGPAPLPLLEQARWYAQQGRVSQAYAGLHMDNMVSADSKRLALHALGKLPGWSDRLRLEIREGRIDGPLLDGIGNEAAEARKYLIKKGPFYQAVDERGEALNSVPRAGENFFASLMHALPDESRQALGIPEVGQDRTLRQMTIDYAMKHRAEMARVLEQHAARAGRTKAPVPIRAARIGYYASGRGPTMDATLVSRVQDVYPALSNQQANSYLLKLRQAGQTDAQIYGHLQERLREWQTLEATLENWAQPQAQGAFSSMFGARAIAERIKTAWRNAPLADENPAYRKLEIVHFGSLPSLSADFSHIRDLILMVSDKEALLEVFPNVQKLQTTVNSAEFEDLFPAIERLQQLTHLNLGAPPTPALSAALARLTRLEELSVTSSSSSANPVLNPMLDVTPLERLRLLEINDPQMTQWPTGIRTLPRLERLNLRRTAINEVPVDLYTEHERLLSGLSLDWSRFSREVFRPIYDYISARPGHLIDLEEMVGDYCRGELRRLVDLNEALSNILTHKFAEQWSGAQARLDAIEALSAQHLQLSSELTQWVAASENVGLAPYMRMQVQSALKTCWRNGVLRRYGSTTGSASLDALLGHLSGSSDLDLPNMQLSSFPDLPADSFSNVRVMRLMNMRAPVESLRGFIRHFSSLQILDLSGSNLSEAPLVGGDLPALEHLSLRNNPLSQIDVSAMSRLQSLDLGGTQLQSWPTGAQDLPQLTWLDLRDSQLTTLPPQALADDQLLISLNLTGAPLTEQAQTALATALQRVERTRGLSTGTLSRFALEDVPEQFPPEESGTSVASQLLALPAPEPVGATPSLAQRLHRLFPALEADEPQAWIAQLRAEGASDAQLHQRLNDWNQTLEVLTRRLNDWLYIRESRGRDWVVSAQTRRLGALRIVESWRNGRLVGGGAAETELNLNGLQLGDLPALPMAMDHVQTLSLTGVRLTEQGSSAFLGAFTQLRTLELSGNVLDALPEPVQSMSHLERLELSTNQLVNAEPLYSVLSSLEHLQWLDLSFNDLESFRADGFEQLVNLDLRNNRLTQWPDGALQARHLRELNLSNNEIESIPQQALEGPHDQLMLGVDLSDNYNLSIDSLERLRDYAERTGRNEALGMPLSDIEQMIVNAGSEPGSASEDESVEPDEEVPQAPATAVQRGPWFDSLAPETVAEHQALWDQLEAEPDNNAFFHLLLRLQDTQEFRVARADLTRRVWEVLKAAASNTELRQTLFASANTHGTCVDGRILTFSGLEVKVFEYKALLDIDPARLDQKGAALLKLSRQLFRLDVVEELAAKAPGHHPDPAEVRLEYRIGLKDLLDLPGQPQHMVYGKPITGERLATAFDEVKAAENSDGFYANLISRDYWVDYLKEKYPESFTRLEQRAAQMHEQLESDHQSFDQAYSEAATRMEIERETERNKLLLELSRKETGEPLRDPDQPGTSRDLMGASGH